MTGNWRLALARLSRRKTQTLACALLLSVGLTAALTLFAAVDATLVRPLPYRDASRLYAVTTQSLDGSLNNGLVTRLEITRLAAGSGGAAAIVGVSRSSDFVMGPAVPQQVRLAEVTVGFFELFGADFQRGRGFLEEEHVSRAPGRAVISWGFWQRAFGGAPGIVGTTLHLEDTRPKEIVGVAPPGFDVPAGTDVWLNDTARPVETARDYEGLVRLAPHATAPEVRQMFDAILAQLARDTSTRTYRVTFTALRTTLVGDIGPALALAAAAAGLLLLLACTTVATVMLMDRAARRRDAAIQLSLGATKARLVRQAFVEALLFGALATALAVPLALAAGHVLGVLAVPAVPGLRVTTAAYRLAAATGVCCLLSAAFVTAPAAISVLRQDAAELVWSTQRSPGRGNEGIAWLTGAGVGLTAFLIVGCGWVVASFRSIQSLDPGFTAANRLVVDVALPIGKGYVRDALTAWFEDLSGRLQRLPGVVHVGYARTIPLGRERDVLRSVDLIGPTATAAGLRVWHRVVSPGFFKAAGVPILKGRAFADSDGPQAPQVVIVNEAFVRSFLGGADPLAYGASYLGFDRRRQPRGAPIVGVVADARYRSLQLAAQPTLYSSTLQLNLPSSPATLVVEAARPPAAALSALIQARVRDLEPAAAVSIEPLDDLVARSASPIRLALALMGSLAIVALVIATAAAYVVAGAGTDRRRREIALRLALGAAPAPLTLFIVKRVSMPGAIGLLLGLATAGAAARAAQQRIAFLQTTLSVEQGVAVGLLVLALTVATVLPAVRAAHLDASTALKE
jgi:putative ABC transport system permease protein